MTRWRFVLSDESRFLLFRSDSRQRVYRRTGERYTDACVSQVDRFGGGGIMVWTGIAHGHKTELVFIGGLLNAQNYCDTIFNPLLFRLFNVMA